MSPMRDRSLEARTGSTNLDRYQGPMDVRPCEQPHSLRGGWFMTTTVQVTTNIRPCHVDIPDEKLADLRRRIAATRWPSAELVTDSSQGVQSKMLQKLVR